MNFGWNVFVWCLVCVHIAHFEHVDREFNFGYCPCQTPAGSSCSVLYAGYRFYDHTDRQYKWFYTTFDVSPLILVQNRNHNQALRSKIGHFQKQRLRPLHGHRMHRLHREHRLNWHIHQVSLFVLIRVRWRCSRACGWSNAVEAERTFVHFRCGAAGCHTERCVRVCGAVCSQRARRIQRDHLRIRVCFFLLLWLLILCYVAHVLMLDRQTNGRRQDIHNDGRQR